MVSQRPSLASSNLTSSVTEMLIVYVNWNSRNGVEEFTLKKLTLKCLQVVSELKSPRFVILYMKED